MGSTLDLGLGAFPKPAPQGVDWDDDARAQVKMGDLREHRAQMSLGHTDCSRSLRNRERQPARLICQSAAATVG